MNFDLLTNTILDTHTSLQQSAVKAINIHLTIRNWLIGFYIVEFEQKGEDRAKYGEKLMESLSIKLNNKSLSESNLKVFRQFYLAYPQIGQSVIAQLQNLGFTLPPIRQSLIVELQNTDNQVFNENESIVNTESNVPQVPPEKILTKLSYTHLVQLFPISNPLKRTFYEIQAIKGTWSVSELKRQIASLYFERSGMSTNPEKLSQITHEKAEINNHNELIKSPFVFEFLGLKSHEAILENDLEAGLVEHLQDFMLEMGHGFCFEARQKRILIDEEYYFVDLVFYHRILKCHVLLELKTDIFKSEYASQLNTYVAYFNAEVKREDDNPTIGILLCTQKGKKLVDYALAGMDKNLFVSKYLVELPTEEQFIAFIKSDLQNI
jgi:predicted nuclease of restriction endonuclease-like (RecB) superfamily